MPSIVCGANLPFPFPFHVGKIRAQTELIGVGGKEKGGKWIGDTWHSRGGREERQIISGGREEEEGRKERGCFIDDVCLLAFMR